VWGESDNLRMLDRTNALDTTWHGGGLGRNTWDDLRIPYWTIKGIYSFGKVGPLVDVFVETYWIPGHWVRQRLAFYRVVLGGCQPPTHLLAVPPEETSNC